MCSATNMGSNPKENQKQAKQAESCLRECEHRCCGSVPKLHSLQLILHTKLHILQLISHTGRHDSICAHVMTPDAKSSQITGLEASRLQPETHKNTLDDGLACFGSDGKPTRQEMHPVKARTDRGGTLLNHLQT